MREVKAIILKDYSIIEEQIKSCTPLFIWDSRKLSYFRKIDFLEAYSFNHHNSFDFNHFDIILSSAYCMVYSFHIENILKKIQSIC